MTTCRRIVTLDYCALYKHSTYLLTYVRSEVFVATVCRFVTSVSISK